MIETPTKMPFKDPYKMIENNDIHYICKFVENIISVKYYNFRTVPTMYQYYFLYCNLLQQLSQRELAKDITLHATGEPLLKKGNP